MKIYLLPTAHESLSLEGLTFTPSHFCLVYISSVCFEKIWI